MSDTVNNQISNLVRSLHGGCHMNTKMFSIFPAVFLATAFCCTCFVFEDWIQFCDNPQVENVLFRMSWALAATGFSVLSVYDRSNGPKALVFVSVAFGLSASVSFLGHQLYNDFILYGLIAFTVLCLVSLTYIIFLAPANDST